MNILLLQAPVRDFYTTRERHYPLGLLTLAAAVKDLPVSVKILDFLHDSHREMRPLPTAFKALAPLLTYDKGPLKSFHNYFRFGASDKDMRRELSAEKADLIGISANFYTYIPDVLDLVRLVREIHPHVCIVVGGQAVTPFHNLFSGNPDIDVLVEGEGEAPFRDIVQEMLKTGAPHRSDSKPIRMTAETESPQDRPFLLPESRLLPPDAYQVAGRNTIMMTLTRGCPMPCSFCTIRKTFGRVQRRLPVPEVLAFMDREVKRGITAFDIEDDNFTFNRNYAHEFLDAVLNGFGEKNLDLYAMNGMDAATLDAALLVKMQRAGFRMLNLSIALKSASSYPELRRQADSDHFARICDEAGRLGMKTVAYFIAGLPDTHADDVLQSMRFLAELPVILGISPFYYIPGMDLQPSLRPSVPEEARLSRFFPSDPSWSEASLITLFRLSRLVNALKRELEIRNTDQLPWAEFPGFIGRDSLLGRMIAEKILLGIDSSGKTFVYTSYEPTLSAFFTSMETALISKG